MINADLARWLDQSTRGLEQELADLIRDEITAHYEDAVADYVADGYSAQDAHIAAMRDLGDESAVGQAFRHVHHSSRRYLLYALVGALYPLAYLLSIPFNERLVGGVAFNIAIFLPIIYIISSFRTLFRDRYNSIAIEKNIMLVRWGIIITCITRFIGWEIYHQPTIIESYTRSIFDAVSPFELVLNLVSIAGLLLAASGFIFIGEQTLHLRESAYGLLKPVGTVIMVCGASFAVYGLSSMLGNAPICMLAEMVAVMSGILATLAWSYVFWRERQEQSLVLSV